MKITDIVPYFNSNGDEKAAVITAIHKDGTVDLCVLAANTRRVQTRVWKEPGTCQVMPGATTDPFPTGELSPPVMAPLPQDATETPAEGETTVTEAPELTDLAKELHGHSHHKKGKR